MREISDALPGADLIKEGLRDLENGVESVSSLLVLIGAPRLRRLGFDVPDTPDYPEDRLYAQLAVEYGNGAHSKYNALIRRLVSFERAAACVQTSTR
jgi:monomeric isocitrate dehydrogenase